jgi:hypothetical protein
MIHLFVRQNVADYETWRLVYDRFYSNPEAHGAPTRTVFQSIDDPNEITVEHIFKNLADARTLVSSTDLAQAMTDAGVLGTPQIWLVEKR